MDVKQVLGKIYKRCFEKNVKRVLDVEVEEVYDKYHDSIVDYKMEDQFEEAKLSIKSKFLGLLLRVSEIICLLRNALQSEESSQSCIVTKLDIEMDLKIFDYSVQMSFSLLKSTKKTGGGG